MPPDPFTQPRNAASRQMPGSGIAHNACSFGFVRRDPLVSVGLDLRDSSGRGVFLSGMTVQGTLFLNALRSIVHQNGGIVMMSSKGDFIESILFPHLGMEIKDIQYYLNGGLPFRVVGGKSLWEATTQTRIFKDVVATVKDDGVYTADLPSAPVCAGCGGKAPDAELLPDGVYSFDLDRGEVQSVCQRSELPAGMRFADDEFTYISPASAPHPLNPYDAGVSRAAQPISGNDLGDMRVIWSPDVARPESQPEPLSILRIPDIGHTPPAESGARPPANDAVASQAKPHVSDVSAAPAAPVGGRFGLPILDYSMHAQFDSRQPAPEPTRIGGGRFSSVHLPAFREGSALGKGSSPDDAPSKSGPASRAMDCARKAKAAKESEMRAACHEPRMRGHLPGNGPAPRPATEITPADMRMAPPHQRHQTIPRSSPRPRRRKRPLGKQAHAHPARPDSAFAREQELRKATRKAARDAKARPKGPLENGKRHGIIDGNAHSGAMRKKNLRPGKPVNAKAITHGLRDAPREGHHKRRLPGARRIPKNAARAHGLEAPVKSKMPRKGPTLYSNPVAKPTVKKTKMSRREYNILHGIQQKNPRNSTKRRARAGNSG